MKFKYLYTGKIYVLDQIVLEYGKYKFYQVHGDKFKDDLIGFSENCLDHEFIIIEDDPKYTQLSLFDSF